MNVLFVSAEVSPFAKVGGLGDVAAALPMALRKLGVDVRIMMPRYEHLESSPRLERIIESIDVELGSGVERVKLYRTSLPRSNVIVYLLENETFLSHGPVYNERGDSPPFSDLARFLFFSAAVARAIPKLGWPPHIVHCHDWHAGMVPYLLFRHGLYRMTTVFTIHNLAHQGTWEAEEILRFLKVGLRDHPNLTERDLHGDFNLMQQGILGASTVNTVSPQFANEILTPELGFGLDSTLRQKTGGISGILNGIDTESFDPATDGAIPVRYSAASVARKVENKLALHERCGFVPDAHAPTLGFVGRLTDQKGVDLILEKATMFVKKGARLVLLGTGLPPLEERLRALAAAHPQSLYCRIGFDDRFARLIYAGTDLFLMPSKFEPCGMGQMIAMRYGTPTIARATGGLKDTVIDVSQHRNRGLGFTFEAYSSSALGTAVARALTFYRDQGSWRALVVRCMREDFSWTKSARSYLALYERTRGTK